MSTKFGRIPEYDPFSVDWKEYSEQLEQFFLANDVDTSEKKRAILLSSCGSAAYSLFRNLVAPAAPKDKTFEQLIEVMETHQNPTPSIIVEHFKFYKRDRELTETVSTYISELKKLSRTCDFGTGLNDMLRDRLVCGIHNDRIQPITI